MLGQMRESYKCEGIYKKFDITGSGSKWGSEELKIVKYVHQA